MLGDGGEEGVLAAPRSEPAIPLRTGSIISSQTEGTHLVDASVWCSRHEASVLRGWSMRGSACRSTTADAVLVSV